jgi:hypothetical protein
LQKKKKEEEEEVRVMPSDNYPNNRKIPQILCKAGNI